jgi:hypothetical protein
MIIYHTATLLIHTDLDEDVLLREMGKSDWILACASTINNGAGAKYYFYKDIPNY